MGVIGGFVVAGKIQSKCRENWEKIRKIQAIYGENKEQIQGKYRAN